MSNIDWSKLLGGGAAAGLGAGMSLFGGKRQPQTTQLQRFTPEQQSALSQLLQTGLQGLQNPMEGFEPIAQQAKRQFQQETVPSLAERFTSLGGGAQRSSAFQGALGRAGAGLSENLAGMGTRYGLQRQGQLQNLLGMGLTPQFENIYQEGGAGRAPEFGQQLMSQALPLLLALL